MTSLIHQQFLTYSFTSDSIQNHSVTLVVGYSTQAGSSTRKLDITSVEIWHPLKHEKKGQVSVYAKSATRTAIRRYPAVQYVSYERRPCRILWIQFDLGRSCRYMICYNPVFIVCSCCASRTMTAHLSSVGKSKRASICTSTVNFNLWALVP